MQKRLRRILIAVVIGLALSAAGILILSVALQEKLPRYQGRVLNDWLADRKSADASVSNRACAALVASIPQLTDTIFNDTNDSKLRLALIGELNELPGIQICFSTAEGRREVAVQALGLIGPRARSAVPDLIKVVKGKDPATRPGAALALGQIQHEPQTVIPVLIGLLDDPQEDVPENAIEALGDFGALSKAAVPKMLEMLKLPDKDMQVALRTALKKIDPEEAAKAGIK
ncbi:MAG: hypothetical protein C5B50_09845 [Verrucomicrobia bacterium]|nr:MAG: hypothetical protein C5B50_09845 [Verrucomicrobiota bacterium]